jgi:hypothetical protein
VKQINGLRQIIFGDEFANAVRKFIDNHIISSWF